MDLSPDRVGPIQLEETQFTAGVSEYTAQRIGKNVNHLLEKTIQTHKWTMNNSMVSFYNISLSGVGIDTLFVPDMDIVIVDLVIYAGLMGTSGDHEFDVEHSADWNGSIFGAWSSILSTTPKVNFSAPPSATFRVGSTVTGCTAPVISGGSFNMNAYDRLRLRMPQVQGGSSRHASVEVKYRSR